MIVNPKEFNYRLAFGSVIVVFMTLAAFGIVSYSELKSDADYFEQEKKLLRQELSSFIERFDELRSEKDVISSEYDKALLSARITLDSLETLKGNIAVLSRLKSELNFLKRQTKTLKVDSLKGLIEDLETDKEEISRILIEQTMERDRLRAQNEYLSELIRSGNQVLARSFNAVAQRVGGDEKVFETIRANRADQVEVCFVLGENPLAETGKKELYLQIVGPDNNVINDKGAVNFGELSLIYSAKIEVEYNRENLEICEIIPNSETFKKGPYYISLFENERRLGGTLLELE